MSKRVRIVVTVAAVVAVAAAAWALFGRADAKQSAYLTAFADRGTVVQSVATTGTLTAVTTVKVGSQVSGIIDSLAADFNSRVRKGQVIARLDPSLFQARLGQARANLTAARANTDRASAALADARGREPHAGCDECGAGPEPPRGSCHP